MSLDKPISDFRKDLLRLVADNKLSEALDRLSEHLPESSGKQKSVVLLQRRLKELKEDNNRGTLESNVYKQQLAVISEKCYDLITNLEIADFEEKPISASGKSETATGKIGTILYQIPHKMPIRKPSTCIIRVAVDEEAIWEGLTSNSDISKPRPIEVSPKMNAQLIDIEGNVFVIERIGSDEQWVRDWGYTQWKFRVTPNVAGKHELQVTVLLLQRDPYTNEYVPYDVSFTEIVTIVTDPFVASDSDEYKSSSQQVLIGSQTSEPLNFPKPKSPNRSRKALAAFLLFLLLTPAATWAIISPPVSDLFWTTWRAKLGNNPAAFDEYITKYKDDPNARPYLDKAYFRKADQTEALTDLRAYLREFPQGEYKTVVEDKIRLLENKAFESIKTESEPTQQNPTPKKDNVTKIEKEEKERKDKDKEKAHLAELQRSAEAAKDQDERDRLTTEAAQEANRIRIRDSIDAVERSRALVEQQRLEAEARRDSDGDGILDKDDKCPNEKGDAANKGCSPKKPTLPPPPVGLEDNPSTQRSGLHMLRVKSGHFIMGDDETDNERPTHRVFISNFSIGKYEVTQADWRAVMGDDPPKLYNKDCNECPVEGVSWEDIQVFINTLNKLTKTGKKYRLPTEAEWEYSSRGGAMSRGYKYSGGNNLDKLAWYNGNNKGKPWGAKETTHRVGDNLSNELGIYDMSGNVWEYCSDQWHPNYAGAPTDGSAWFFTKNANKVVRGGAWSSNVDDCTVSKRKEIDPKSRLKECGFRLAHD